MSFIAKYNGACADCEEGIRPGDEVAYRGEDEDRVLAHVKCPEAVRFEDVQPPCEACWLIHPEGACDA